MDIFDRLMAFDDARQAEQRRRDRIAQLRENSAQVCGHCNHWMKYFYCPAEKNVNGYSRGPSCGDMRAMNCSKWQRDQASAKALAELQEALSPRLPSEGGMT